MTQRNVLCRANLGERWRPNFNRRRKIADLRSLFGAASGDA